MFSKFFINRPIFATVLALLIVVAGLIALNILPVAQFPEITPQYKCRLSIPVQMPKL